MYCCRKCCEEPCLLRFEMNSNYQNHIDDNNNKLKPIGAVSNTSTNSIMISEDTKYNRSNNTKELELQITPQNSIDPDIDPDTDPIHTPNYKIEEEYSQNHLRMKFDMNIASESISMEEISRNHSSPLTEE